MQFSPNDRHILVITDERDTSLAYAKAITSDLDSVEINEHTKAQRFLGQELDAVIYDMHTQFDPNTFGAITGTIRGGGYLIILRPKQAFPSSLFLKRFNRILEHTPSVHFLELSTEKAFLLAKPQHQNYAQSFATTGQENAVNTIIKVVTGHRRRPLVITSDRGRGKSAALGIAAAELAKQGVENIIICAPSKKSAAIVFKHAECDNATHNNLTFYSPDELQQQKPKADLVLIDEAAAIPIPILTTYLKHYSRIVFASTQHGYEGCGRGFTINFRKVLDRDAPQWKNCELKTPIRWQENDALEQFTFDALLLNTESTEESLIKNVTLDNCQFSQINKAELLKDNSKLKQLFGLLVNAHYQTKPSDLLHLLDDESVNVFCLEANSSIVAVALLITEGDIDPELADDIFKGKRRLRGHLVAQALSSNIGIKHAPQLLGERISRIAVHPALQGKGLGSRLVQVLIERSNADYLSTSYGATQPLINFWKKSDFVAVHLGIKRDASSGAHAVTMLHSITDRGLSLAEQAQSIFSRNFPHLLTDSFSRLESEIVFSLLPRRAKKILSDEDRQIIDSFVDDSRGYENSLYLIWQLVLDTLVSAETLYPDEIKLLILKVLQKQTWESVIDAMKTEISGKKDALTLLREAVSKLR